MLKVVQLLGPAQKQIKIETNQKFFQQSPKLKWNEKRLKQLSQSKTRWNNQMFQCQKKIEKNSCQNKNGAFEKKDAQSLKINNFNLDYLQKIMAAKRKKYLVNKHKNKENESTFSRNSKLMHFSAQDFSQKCYLLLQKDKKIIEQKKRLKQTQKNNTKDIKSLFDKNTKLKQIYQSLYNLYESVPFTQKEREQEIMQKRIISSQFRDQVSQQNDKFSRNKERQKTFKNNSVKLNAKLSEVEPQQNIRKEIKSLTRDTNHILSIEFKEFKKP